MSEVIVSRNIKLNVDASDWRDSMVKSGQLLVDKRLYSKDYIDLTIKCVEKTDHILLSFQDLHYLIQDQM